MILISIRTVILYITVLVSVRLMGKSELSKISPFQFVIIFMIAELATLSFDGSTSSLLYGVTAILTLLFLQVLIAFISTKIPNFNKLVNGSPSILIDNGNINVDELKKQRITLTNLTEQLRIKDCPSITDVSYAILESNGALSVIKNDANSSMPLIIISDGKLNKNNLTLAKVKERNLKTLFNKLSIDENDVFLRIVDGQKQIHLYVYPKAGKIYSEDITKGGVTK